MSEGKHMLKHISVAILLALSLAMVSIGPRSTAASQTTYDTNTLAGKAAAVQAAQNQGLEINLSNFILQEADASDLATSPAPNTLITPSHVLSSTLDGQTVQAPDVTVNQDTAAATQNEPVIAADPNNPNRIVAASNDYVTRTCTCTVRSTPCRPFPRRVSVSRTRQTFSASTGAHVQSPILFAYSVYGGQPFSNPQLPAGNVLYSQASHVMVGPDGTVYVLWDGATRFGPFDSTWMSKSTDGGVSWTKPLAIASLVDIFPPANTAFRVNSFPAGDVAPNGDVSAPWPTESLNTASSYGVDLTCASGATVYASCHAAVYWSESSDHGATWTTPQLAFPAIDASSRTAIGYPVTQPIGGATLNAPAPRRVDTFFPAVAISPQGNVYMSAYAADVVSPWQRCAQPDSPTAVGRINCLQLDNYIKNARLDS